MVEVTVTLPPEPPLPPKKPPKKPPPKPPPKPPLPPITVTPPLLLPPWNGGCGGGTNGAGTAASAMR